MHDDKKIVEGQYRYDSLDDGRHDLVVAGSGHNINKTRTHMGTCILTESCGLPAAATPTIEARMMAENFIFVYKYMCSNGRRSEKSKILFLWELFWSKKRFLGCDFFSFRLANIWSIAPFFALVADRKFLRDVLRDENGIVLNHSVAPATVCRDERYLRHWWWHLQPKVSRYCTCASTCTCTGNFCTITVPGTVFYL